MAASPTWLLIRDLGLVGVPQGFCVARVERMPSREVAWCYIGRVSSPGPHLHICVIPGRGQAGSAQHWSLQSCWPRAGGS